MSAPGFFPTGRTHPLLHGVGAPPEFGVCGWQVLGGRRCQEGNSCGALNTHELGPKGQRRKGNQSPPEERMKGAKQTATVHTRGGDVRPPRVGVLCWGGGGWEWVPARSVGVFENSFLKPWKKYIFFENCFHVFRRSDFFLEPPPLRGWWRPLPLRP